MTDSEQLMTVAAWIDKMFPNDPGPEVQTDLRRIAIKLLDLEAELARVKEAAGLLGHECERARYLEVLRREAPQIAGEVRRELNFAQASVDANPTAAALVEQARKEKP